MNKYYRINVGCLICLLLLQSGCRELTKYFVDQDIKPEQLIGYWIITEDSVQNMIKVAGIVKYTNRTDNIILLKEDGICIYRAFSDYSGRHSVVDDYETYAFSGGKIYGDSWYEWDPQGENILRGPFSSNISKDEVKSGRYILNKWPYWELIDYSKWPKPFTGEGQRYQLGFGFSKKQGPSVFWDIGSIKDELVLWQPTWPPGSLINLVKFRKITADELREIIKKEIK